MRNDDVLAQLRAVDPARGTDLSRTDRGALVALREGITMTARTSTTTARPARRLATRGGVALLAGVMLVGGGGAYAAYERLYVGGAADGITCLTQWSDWPAMSTGGPPLTGDPVADCQHYNDLEGVDPIADPVAFRFENMLFVAPRGDVPEGSSLLAAPTAQDEARRELQASLHDLVDGLRAQCFTADEASAFVTGELDRLALTGWQLEVAQNEPSADRPDDLCATAWADEAGADVIQVTPNSVPAPEVLEANEDVVPFVFALADTLRQAVADQCLSLSEAEEVATTAIGAEHHWPLTTITDPTADCTRVDMEVGGSILVTLRGPEAAKP